MAASTGPTPFGASNNTAPAQDGYTVSPSDTTNFNIMFRALYVGGAGTVVLVTASGTVLTFVAVPAGTILPVTGVRVNNTNTTATSMVALI